MRLGTYFLLGEKEHKATVAALVARNKALESSRQQSVPAALQALAQVKEKLAASRRANSELKAKLHAEEKDNDRLRTKNSSVTEKLNNANGQLHRLRERLGLRAPSLFGFA